MNAIAQAAKRRLYWLVGLMAAVAAGWLWATHIPTVIPDALVLGLISVGLYVAATGIDPSEARRDSRLIVSAVTLGVIAKAALVAGLSFALTRNVSISLACGVVFSQIDPISVGAMEKSSRMSRRAKHVIHAWACYDDPVSVLLARYVVPLVVVALGGVATSGAATNLSSWVVQLLLNAAFAGVVYITWRVLPQRGRRTFEYSLLAITLAAGTLFGLTLAVAITGLFLRPLAEKFAERSIQLAYFLAAMLVGTLLVHGVNLALGVAVGIIAYGAHFAVSELLTHLQGLDARDRRHLRLGQQSGITACSLVLLFTAALPGLAPICAVAIVAVNTLHLAANTLLDWSESKATVVAAAAVPSTEE